MIHAAASKMMDSSDGHRNAAWGDAIASLPTLVETKLWPPLVRDGALPRAHLVATLAKRIDRHAVTLLSAGAGYGKTSLLASWYARQPVPDAIAWVTLDGADDDPVRLWAHIGEALRRTYRDRLDEAADPLPTSVSEAVSTLVNELAAIRAPRVLVLDDVHHVGNRACAESLDVFVAAMPPTTRLLIASRADPPISLARLRAAGHLGELRARQLAYSKAETQELVERMPESRLRTRDAERLRRRTEGWPAGMYLALLAAAERDDPHAFVEEFAGDVHTIADYLAAEVLAHLDEPTRAFLVQSSVLDELCGALCDAALDTSGSADRLIELERSNLFIVPLDERREWFRYQELFRDLLRLESARLDPELRADVHRRASAWFSSVGGRPQLAIEHSLGAGDWTEAADVIARTAVDATGKGRWVTVFGWLSALPREEFVARPVLPALAAALETALGEPWESVRQHLECYEESLRIHPDGWTPESQTFAAFPRAAHVGIDIGGAVEAALLLCKVAAHTDLGVGAIARGALAWALFLAGNLDEARSEAETALAYEHPALWAGSHITANAVLSVLAVDDGDAPRALEFGTKAVQSADQVRADQSPAAARARIANAVALSIDGKLEQAENEAVRALGTQGPPQDGSHVFELIALASIRRRRGRLGAARKTLDQAERMLDGFVDPGQLPELLAAERQNLVAEEAAADGTEPLSDAELRVLRLLATEMSRSQIGGALFLSENTVKTHCSSIYRKLRVRSRPDAVARAIDLGLLDGDSPG
jgi:ATP/maltotriose-dependent transcriptional regulator MalT